MLTEKYQEQLLVGNWARILTVSTVFSIDEIYLKLIKLFLFQKGALLIFTNYASLSAGSACLGAYCSSSSFGKLIGSLNPNVEPSPSFDCTNTCPL